MPDRAPPDDPVHHDPLDQAYGQAEALLSDDQARAARRARVLDAMAGEAAALAPSAPTRRRSFMRQGGWLAVACVVGLSVLVTTHLYRPEPIPPRTAPAADMASSGPAPSMAAAPTPPAPARSEPPAPRAFASASRSDASEAAPAARSIPPATTSLAPAPPPPTPAIQAYRSAPVPAAPFAGPTPESVRDESANAPKAAPPIVAGAADASATASLGSPRPMASARIDAAARLRAAAETGRTADVEALLARGAPVDSPDADGDTALMRSIQADHPAAAAMLRRHGANLDRRNHRGESARDMARAKGDAALDEALGLKP